MRLECVEPLDLDSHEPMLHCELSDCCNALGALLGDLVEMPADGGTLDALAGHFGKTGGSFYQSLANAVAQTEQWKTRMYLWMKNRDVVTTLAAPLKRHTTQLAMRTSRHVHVVGRGGAIPRRQHLHCATRAHLQFPDAGGGPSEEISRFPTEDSGS